MPTNAASNATAPRIRSASATSAASASGICGVSPLLIEVGLQDDLRGDLVATGTRLASTALAIQPVLHDFGRPPLVDQRNRQTKTFGEPPREIARLGRHRVWRAVGMHRQADQEVLR